MSALGAPWGLPGCPDGGFLSGHSPASAKLQICASPRKAAVRRAQGGRSAFLTLSDGADGGRFPRFCSGRSAASSGADGGLNPRCSGFVPLAAQRPASARMAGVVRVFAQFWPSVQFWPPALCGRLTLSHSWSQPKSPMGAGRRSRSLPDLVAARRPALPRMAASIRGFADLCRPALRGRLTLSHSWSQPKSPMGAGRRSRSLPSDWPPSGQPRSGCRPKSATLPPSAARPCTQPFANFTFF